MPFSWVLEGGKLFQLAKFLFGEFCIFSIGKVWIIADVKCFVNDKTPKMIFLDFEIFPNFHNFVGNLTFFAVFGTH